MREPSLAELPTTPPLLGDPLRPHGVTLAFSGREGGVSSGPYATLNIGARVGDDPACVEENRRRVLAALGGEDLSGRLIAPKQVHGTHVVRLADPSDGALRAARREAEEGADAVCVSVPLVPVLLCFADCVPVILTVPGAFAVVHSGWRGTIARIGALALSALLDVSGASPADAIAYVGPHIQARDYEVSEELLRRFVAEFGEGVASAPRRLSLAAAIEETLVSSGVSRERIIVDASSTAALPERYFSHRRDGSPQGRQGAIAWLAA